MAEQASVAVNPPSEPPAGFRSLMRNRNYALLWSGQLISEMGNRFHWIAVSLWIYSLTQSAAAVSLAISSMFIGSVLVSLWAGAFVDRLSRKSILVASDLVRAILVALIPWLVQTNLWLVYLDLALISVATAFFRPAIFAIVPQVVHKRDLMAANSFFTAMETGTEILGPIAAGFIAQSFGYAPLLYADGVTYLFSAICVSWMTVTRHSSRRGLDIGTVWSDVVDGLKYIRTDSLQRGLFVLIFPATLVGAGLNALQTPLAKGEIRITDAQFGTFQSVWGLGFVVASLILGWYGASLRKSRIILAGYFLSYLATGLMGLSGGFSFLLGAAFIVGFSNTLYYVGLGTVLMEYTPSDLVGRVVSTRQLALAVARVASPLIFGALAVAGGIRQAVILMAAVGTVATALTVWRFPSVRKFDEGLRGPAGSITGPLARLLTPVDPDFGEAPQRWLNAGALLIVLVAWAGVAMVRHDEAVLLLAVALGLALFGLELRRRRLLP